MGQYFFKVKPVERDPILPVLEAIREGKISTLQEYHTGIQDLERLSDNGKPLLQLAIKHGQVLCIEYLLRIGISPNIVDDTSVTPLHELVQAKGLKPDEIFRIIELLLAHGANINSPNAMKRTPLLKSIILFRHNIAEILLENKASVHLADADGLLPIHVCATYANVGILHMLLHAGANINAQDKKGRTPLYYAVLSGHQNIVEVLLRFGCDINIGSVFGFPLQTAIIKCKLEAIHLLIDHGANLGFSIKEHRHAFSKAKDCLNLALVVLQTEYAAAQTILRSGNTPRLLSIVCIVDLILQSMGSEVNFVKNIFVKSRKSSPINFDEVKDAMLRRKLSRVCRKLVFIHAMQQQHKGVVVSLDGMPKFFVERHSLENICRMRVRKLLMNSGTNVRFAVNHLDCSNIVKDLLLLKDV